MQIEHDFLCHGHRLLCCCSLLMVQLSRGQVYDEELGTLSCIPCLAASRRFHSFPIILDYVSVPTFISRWLVVLLAKCFNLR